jgi:hypothetical protein
MDNHKYHDKYLKYKKKYLNLKQEGGTYNNVITDFYDKDINDLDFETNIIEIDDNTILTPIYLDISKYPCKKNCFVISLFGKNSDYVIGAINQAQAFIDNNDNNLCDIICLCTPDIGKFQINLLSEFFTYVIILPYLKYEKPIVKKIIETKPHYAKVWFKLHALRLTNYEKICLIDSDYLSIKPLAEIFKLNAPAACSELPNTFIDREQQIFYTTDSGEIILNKYENDWYNLYGENCKNNNNYSGFLILFLLYSNNNYIDVFENDKILDDKKESHGNYLYGGMNASIMLLKPDINEFNNIINDIYNYGDNRLFYTYPEQQYLTARYSLKNNYDKEEFKKNFYNLFKNFFQNKQKNYIFLKKLFYTINLKDNKFVFEELKKKKYDLLILERNKYIEELKIENNEENIKNLDLEENKIIEYIIEKLFDIFWDYYNNNHVKTDLYVNEWNCISLEYYITEYYYNLPPKNNWKGFPILQQTKLWTSQGIEEINNKPHHKRGHVEWFEQLQKTLNNIKKIKINTENLYNNNNLSLIEEKKILNNYIYYLFQKINYIEYIIKLYYNSLNIKLYNSVYQNMNYKKITLNYLDKYYEKLHGEKINLYSILNDDNNKLLKAKTFISTNSNKFMFKRSNTINE